jgi:3-deoxy-D-manno-octulosonate 8-phosphate phosphatase (KDO 8-P phosphatase)
MISDRTLRTKARRITFILLDVDGVMTDGGIYYTAAGAEMKRFHAHDGYGIARAQLCGLRFGIISGRTTPIVTRRARDLKIRDVVQGRDDKLAVYHQLKKRLKLDDASVCFMGDDLFDLPLLEVVGFSAAPANARPEVKRAVDYVCKARGGEGAVRELIDIILAVQHR